ncbi:MAG: exosortase/archaeosortase family protein [Phycisphaera sp.]|nr:MAG: exosortase/archaeosortase family protein [Phycisphaera sp.]
MSVEATTWGRWAPLQAIAATLAAILACLPAWRDIYISATADPDNGYIVLVPAVAGWLALCRRRRLRSAGRRGLWLGPVIVAVAGLIYVLAGTFGPTLALHLGAIGVLIGAIWSVVGRSVMLRMSPAVFALFFLAPAPMEWLLPVSNILGSWSLAVTAGLLEILGVTAYVNGRDLIVGTAELSLGGFAGVRMIAAIGLVTYAFAFGMPLRHGVRIGLVLASPLVAIVANVVRLVPFAILADNWPASATMLAQMSGWLTLALALGMLYGGIRLLRYAQVPARRYALAYQ